jgi:hypothetical protein
MEKRRLQRVGSMEAERQENRYHEGLKVITNNDVGEEVNRHKTKGMGTIKDGVKIGHANGEGQGTSKGQISKLPLSN